MQNFKKAEHVSHVYAQFAGIRRLRSILSMLLLVPFAGFSQTTPIVNSTLKGKVIDAVTRQGIPGVNVSIIGTTHAVQTDKQGVFGFVTGQKFPYT
ncbi:MAG TPA: carboxypeptidase-like regulatory domain-containing protein, partial [Pedobacter sp.]